MKLKLYLKYTFRLWFKENCTHNYSYFSLRLNVYNDFIESITFIDH